MQSAEHSGEGRFPGAVDARNGDDFSAACLKREIIQYIPAAETDTDFLNGKQSIGSDCFHTARFGYRQIPDTQSHSANICFRQRLAVVVSEICGKELLVFDEPTSGLDLKSMEEIGTLTRSLATQGKVLLIITHDIEFMMRICTRILFIRDGEIVEDLSGGQKEKIVRLLRGEE